MKDLRRIVGALCIVASMVLGAFAGFAFAQPGVSSAPSTPETRSGTLMVGTGPNEMYTPEEAKSLLARSAEASAEASGMSDGANANPDALSAAGLTT